MKGARGRRMQDRPSRERSEASEEERDRRGEEPRDKVMSAALKILAGRPCSEGELRERLTAKPWTSVRLVDDCVKRLKELGYVNDDRFAHTYASHRVSARPLGRSRVSRELARKKVSRKSIDDALDTVFDEFPEEALIDRAIQRRIRTHGRPADRAAAKRMFDHLARLGFEYDLIIRKLRTLKAEIEEAD